MGGNESKLEKALSPDMPDSEKFFGLENQGNTCYCNSVIQALYFCRPFRRHVLDYYAQVNDSVLGGKEKDTLLFRLSELFARIAHHKKQTGVILPRQFLHKLRKDNEMFEGDDHQDAHEFMNFLLNDIISVLQKQAKPNSSMSEQGKVRTWMHDIFEGSLTNETKCLCCENVTSVHEKFIDLSVDVSHHTSLTACLSRFSSTETLMGTDKFFCDTCLSLQEAQKRMLVKCLPSVLTVHLKRFKYDDRSRQYRKLNSRVVFPFELRVCNTSEDCDDPDRVYSLFAVVIHSGSGLSHGHYVSVIKSHNQWILFDDDRVSVVDINRIQSASFGSSSRATDVAYLLFFSSNDASSTDEPEDLFVTSTENSESASEVDNTPRSSRVESEVSARGGAGGEGKKKRGKLMNRVAGMRS